MPVKLPINFPSYDKSLSFFQQKKIWESFLDLKPYIEDFYIVYVPCMKNKENSIDALSYIFLKDCSDLSTISEKCSKDWNVNISDIKSSRSSLLIRGLPDGLIKEIYPKEHKIHFGGSLKCFHNYLS